MGRNDKKSLIIGHLYPNEMNLYGDTGNVLILQKRLEWRGITAKVVNIGVGDKIPDNIDIIFGGGGQDAEQGKIEKDFLAKKHQLKELTYDGCVMLFICGLYQLMGRKFITQDGDEIAGLGIFPADTYGKDKRIIGNIVIESDSLGTVVGYENHSGQTFLDNNTYAFGRVIKGVGNNDESGSEGCRIENVFGTYLHGPVLAKSPDFADLLIKLALERKGVKIALDPLDDYFAETAKMIASKRPR